MSLLPPLSAALRQHARAALTVAGLAVFVAWLSKALVRNLPAYLTLMAVVAILAFCGGFFIGRKRPARLRRPAPPPPEDASSPEPVGGTLKGR